MIISGGGTGGHIFPAVAIANELKRRDPSCELLFVGANGRMEMQRVPEAGYAIEGLDISGIQRKLDPANLLLPYKVVKSLVKAAAIIDSFSPDIAVGVGGYASGPLLFAASLKGIPTLIQEQNSFAGITNKILAAKAKKICVAFDGMEKYFPAKKIVKTGNPVRSEMVDIAGKKDSALSFFGLEPGRPVVLVIGGSLGARTINRSIAANIETLVAAGLQLVWQTGKGYYEQALPLAGPYVKVFDFIRSMDMAYAAADVVISRAGALSVSELCLVRKPTILVPSPNVAEDHQTKNALALVMNDAAILVKDAEAEQQLLQKLLELIQDEALQDKLSGNMAGLAMPDAAYHIVNEIKNLVP